MNIKHRTIYYAILILGLTQCNAPRRALITLASARVEGEQSYTSQKRSETGRDERSGKTTDRAEPGRRARETGTSGSSVFDLGYNSITDRETNFKWEPHHDNPTSMLRYQMEEQDYSKRLPQFEELVYFFDKVSTDLRTNPNGEITGQMWLQTDGHYISSTEVYSPENKKLYRGLYWNYTTLNYESVNLGPGDLVNVVLITQ